MNFTARAARISEIRETFERITLKHRCNNATLEISEPYSEKSDINKDVVYRLVDVRVDIPAAKGWEVLASLENMNGENIVASFGKDEIPTEFLHGTRCDHCNVNRYRKNTFLLEKDNKIIQVGSSCIKDFSGGSWSELMFHELIAFQKDYGESFLSGLGFGGSPDGANFKTIIAVSKAVINRFGWVSSSATYDNPYSGVTSTKRRVDAYIFEKKREDITPDYEDPEIEKILSWVASLPESETNNSQYLHNLKAVCSQDYVSMKNFGIAVSLVSAYNRAMENAEDGKNSVFLSEVGKRETFEVTLTGKKELPDSGFGVSVLHSFKDERGNVLTWITTNNVKKNVGDKFFITGTVKDHKVFREVKQTVLTRAKIK